MDKVETKVVKGEMVYYRPGTTDENVIREVIEKSAYRRPSVGFDVLPGETWLDLGANIGTFAIHCRIKGAGAICYEPNKECFELLKKNAPDCSLYNSAVTSNKTDRIDLWKSNRKNDRYRGTVLEGVRGFKPNGTVSNVYAGDLRCKVDGIKMDIEGSEFGIIDNWLLPRCDKFCFEYHTSRDRSMKRLKSRLNKLRKHFEVVSYNPELDKLIEMGGFRKSYYDRVIYCIGAK